MAGGWVLLFTLIQSLECRAETFVSPFSLLANELLFLRFTK